MMTPEQIFKVWAPSSSIWSPWVAPVLFIQLTCHGEDASDKVPSVDLGWLSGVCGMKSALIVDLSGPSSVEVGVALFERGYRPVPLYRCCLPSYTGADANTNRPHRASGLPARLRASPGKQSDT